MTQIWLWTLLGFGVFFIGGMYLGIHIENNHQERVLKDRELAFRRWAAGKTTIESEMIADGWKQL